jgi:hypothetical protein
MSSITAPETIEGTWEEISRQADRLNGHRLRVTILPDSEKTPSHGNKYYQVSLLIQHLSDDYI